MTTRLQSALHPAGPDAQVISQLAWMLAGGAALVFVGVMVLCAIGLRGRRTVQPRYWLLGGGMLLPLVVLSALLAFSTWRSAQLSTPSSQHAVRIAVVAHLWWWEVRYTDPRGGPDIVLANEIRIPAGQPVYLGLSSTDVIHSFWVPALAGKVDMVPGRLHGMTLQADREGVYRGQCAEYCGDQHARMALHVVAQGAPEFAAWLAAQARPASVPVAGSMAAAGRRVFGQQRCGACHAIRGVSEAAQGGMAPDLTHLGSRLYLGAGTLRNEPAALAAWIANPHASKPGVRMPASADLPHADLQALASYLEQLK